MVTVFEGRVTLADEQSTRDVAEALDGTLVGSYTIRTEFKAAVKHRCAIRCPEPSKVTDGRLRGLRGQLHHGFNAIYAEMKEYVIGLFSPFGEVAECTVGSMFPIIPGSRLKTSIALVDEEETRKAANALRGERHPDGSPIWTEFFPSTKPYIRVEFEERHPRADFADPSADSLREAFASHGSQVLECEVSKFRREIINESRLGATQSSPIRDSMERRNGPPLSSLNLGNEPNAGGSGCLFSAIRRLWARRDPVPRTSGSQNNSCQDSITSSDLHYPGSPNSGFGGIPSLPGREDAPGQSDLRHLHSRTSREEVLSTDEATPSTELRGPVSEGMPSEVPPGHRKNHGPSSKRTDKTRVV